MLVLEILRLPLPITAVPPLPAYLLHRGRILTPNAADCALKLAAISPCLLNCVAQSPRFDTQFLLRVGLFLQLILEFPAVGVAFVKFSFLPGNFQLDEGHLLFQTLLLQDQRRVYLGI